MKKIFTVILAFFGINFQAQAAQETPEIQSVIDSLRSMALNLKAEDLGLSPKNYPNEVWGILMETGFKNDSYTLLVLADGTTSLYFSNGGGIIGAGTHETVKKASLNLLIEANHFQSKTKSTLTFPYPIEGEVKFYLIGYGGITTYSAREQTLGENKDQLSQLFYATHMVITELRKVEESKHKLTDHP